MHCTPAIVGIHRANDLTKYIMEMTLKEVQDYWRRYCQRHALQPEVVTQGEHLIALDHEYWADHTMQQLKNKVIRHLKQTRAQQVVIHCV